MGMRCDQWIGLNVNAEQIVQGDKVFLYQEKIVRCYSDGHEDTPIERPMFGSSVTAVESDRKWTGMYDEPYHLMDYQMPDGRVFEEHVQADPWSSGPVVFTALKCNNEWLKDSLWSDEEIENA